MKRGDIFTMSGGPGYAGKPRPVAIVQSDDFDQTASVTICPFTSNEIEAPLFRLPIVADGRNGLRSTSQLMVDKITTVARSKLDTFVGSLAEADLVRLNRSTIVFLGLSGARRRM